MTSRLKVIDGNWQGTHRAILACSGKKEFFRATLISCDDASITGNAEEVAQAMTAPGVLFIRSLATHRAPWIIRRRFDQRGN